MRKEPRPCVYCGVVMGRNTFGFLTRNRACPQCTERNLVEAKLAIAQVARSIKRGEMKKAKEHDCTDCGSVASVFDHRDYTRPLDVEPVCRGCNVKRGPAFNSFYRPQERI